MKRAILTVTAALALAGTAQAASNTFNALGCGSAPGSCYRYQYSYATGITSIGPARIYNGTGWSFSDGNDGTGYVTWLQRPAGSCYYVSNSAYFVSNNVGQFLGTFNTDSRACSSAPQRPLPAAVNQL